MKMQVYKALADCYFQPDEQLYDAVQRLKQGIDSWIPENIHLALGMDQELKIQNNDLLELIREYSRLFVGPFDLLAPPYGSLYFQHKHPVPQIMDSSTFDVQEAYSRAGLNVAQDFNSPPDHISAELEFMYFLLFQEFRALENNDPEEALNFKNQRKTFLQRHLGIWGPVFAGKVAENTKSVFYLNLARLTKEVLMKDKKELELIR